jgi:Bor protein
MFRPSVLAVLLLSSVGCFHASVETGMKPGSDKFEKEWASSWVFGLVAPETIEAKSKCTSGVSKVETQHSFLNALVAFFTLQIYTPMDITVTCAAPGSPSSQSTPRTTDGELQARARPSGHCPTHSLSVAFSGLPPEEASRVWEIGELAELLREAAAAERGLSARVTREGGQEITAPGEL